MTAPRGWKVTCASPSTGMDRCRCVRPSARSGWSPEVRSRVFAEEVLGAFVDVGYAFRFGPPGHQLVVARWVGEGGQSLAAPAFHFPLGRPSGIDPELRVEVTSTEVQGRPALALTANRFAQAVSLELDGLEPRDDFFHLEPAMPYVVELVGAGTPRGTAWPLNAPGPTPIGGRA